MRGGGEAEDSENLVLEVVIIKAPAEAISTEEEIIVRTECAEDKDSKILVVEAISEGEESIVHSEDRWPREGLLFPQSL